MRNFSLSGVAQILVTLFSAAVIVLLALFLLAWSGLYNIAASRGHFKAVEWLLTFGMRNSVELHARTVEGPPHLDDPDLYILGASHYQLGCAPCHGAPESTGNPIARTMLPPPPNLAGAIHKWKDRELFWIVKHGIKYTGMPAWPAQSRNDEVWAVVAFVRKLPNLSPQAYRELAFGKTGSSGGEFLTSTASPDLFQSCMRCHGTDGQGPFSRFVPVLHGLRREYLVRQMEAFRSGSRESGIMEPVAAALPADAAQSIAAFYSTLRAPPTSPSDAPADVIEKGRVLAMQGSAHERIPACLSCHRSDPAALYPRLQGQSQDYMANRLRGWKRGGARHHNGTEAIMEPIAKLLSDTQIREASAYFASLPAATASPAPISRVVPP